MSIEEQIDIDDATNLAKLKADAKRYRFLRQFADPAFDDSNLPELPEPTSSEHFDALVDATIIGMGFEKA